MKFTAIKDALLRHKMTIARVTVSAILMGTNGGLTYAAVEAAKAFGPDLFIYIAGVIATTGTAAYLNLRKPKGTVITEPYVDENDL